MPSLFNSLSSSLPVAVGNTLASVNQKISELGGAVASTFGGAGPLSKLTAGSATIQGAAAKVTSTAAALSASGTKQDAIDKMSSLAGTDPANFNATTMLEAAKTTAGDVQEVSAAQIEAAKQESNYDDSYKVRLVGIGKDDAEYELIFDVMPEVVEARNVSYEDVAPPQSIGAFQKFKGTDPVSWNINATFVCRNIEEAGKNLQHLNQLRAWTMPFFGENTRKTFSTRLGAPPPTLLFSGWKQKMVGPTRVVITSLNWTFPRDVDYIAAKTEDDQIVPFPTVMTVAITLKESFSTQEFNNFDLNLFTKGSIPEAYGIRNDGTDVASVVTSLTTEGAGASAADPATSEADGGGESEPSTSSDTSSESTSSTATPAGDSSDPPSAEVKTAEQPKTQTQSPPAASNPAFPTDEELIARRALKQELEFAEMEVRNQEAMAPGYERRLAAAQALPDDDPTKAEKVARAQNMINALIDRKFAAEQRVTKLQQQLAGQG